MKAGNRILLALLALILCPLLGCDVALAGLLASRSNKSSSSSGGPPAPDITYKVYVSDLALGDLNNEKLALDGAGGNPGASWTFVGSGTTTQDFDVSALAGAPFSAILIQAPEAQDYHIDGLELFDANGSAIESAAGASIRSNLLAVGTLEADAAGVPDGRSADTDSTTTASAYLFAHFTNQVEFFRVSLWGVARGSGDLEWVRTFVSPGNQTAGGAAVKSDGTFYVTYSDESPRHVWMIIYLADGNAPGVPAGDPPAPSSLETNVTASISGQPVGSQCVAINGSNVYVATTFGAGDIRVRKLEGPGGTWSTPFSGAGVDLVEANGLAVDDGGNLILSGGFDFGGLEGVGHYMQKLNASGGLVWPGAPTPRSDGTATYWRAVATSGLVDIYTAGDLTPLLSSTQAFVVLSDSSASGAEVRGALDSGSDGIADLGRAVGVDGVGNAYVAGYRGVAGPGRNAFLSKYAPDILSSVSIVSSTLTGDDEILDIAVDIDGSVVAVGYETITSPAQGRNMFVTRFAPNGGVHWRRTYDGSVGNDAAVSVSTTDTHVYVSGEVTVAGGTRDIHVRRYVK